MKWIDRLYKFLPVLSFIVPVVFYSMGFYYSTQYTFKINDNKFKEIQGSLFEIHKTVGDQIALMKSYVDAKDHTTNIRINDLQKDVEKNHYENLLLQQRIDNTLNEIMDIEKQNNERLDKLFVHALPIKN